MGYQMSPRMLALTKPRSSSIKTFFNSISDDYDIRDGDETARRLKSLPKATMTRAVKETRPHVQIKRQGPGFGKEWKKGRKKIRFATSDDILQWSLHLVHWLYHRHCARCRGWSERMWRAERGVNGFQTTSGTPGLQLYQPKCTNISTTLPSCLHLSQDFYICDHIC